MKVGDTLYELIDLFDEHDAMKVVSLRVAKIEKRYTYLHTIRLKIANGDVLKRFAMTPYTAVVLLLNEHSARASAARARVTMEDKLCERYAAFLKTI